MQTSAPPPVSPTLVRAIGRWTLTAAVINSVIGSAIFGMPSAIAAYTGAWSPAVVLLAGACIFPIVLCFAEVGSRFDRAGGPYLYAREAFGAAAGFHVGWLMLWSRLFSGGAVLNVLVAYLTPLVPWVGEPVGRAVTMVAAVAIVTAVNVRGVKQAAWTMNAFALAKLVPLVLVVVLGAMHFRSAVFHAQTVATPDWTEALLLLVFAYGGFEAAVIAGSETRRPREDTAFALVSAMLAITAIYALVQIAVVGVLPNAGASKAPISDALHVTLGTAGTLIAGIAAVLSAYGWLTAFTLLMPRVLYSMAERGEIPSALGRVHATFRTPYVAIAVNSLVALALGLAGTFTATATLSAIARLVVFAATCGSLIALRRRAGATAGFVLPGGTLLATFGIAFTLWLLSTRSFTQAWIVGAIVLTGAAVFATRRATSR
jgi:APA family basic amino acid/polyamine antiporter